MCNCRKNRSAATTTQKYLVLYPDGTTATKTSEIAAKLAAGQVPGAKWSAQGK